VVRSNLVDDLINKVSVAVKNSPLNQGKLALAISQVVNCRRCWHRCRRHRRRTRRSCAGSPVAERACQARPPLCSASHER
jgi:hypothetical protein